MENTGFSPEVPDSTIRTPIYFTKPLSSHQRTHARRRSDDSDADSDGLPHRHGEGRYGVDINRTSEGLTERSLHSEHRATWRTISPARHGRLWPSIQAIFRQRRNGGRHFREVDRVAADASLGSRCEEVLFLEIEAPRRRDRAERGSPSTALLPELQTDAPSRSEVPVMSTPICPSRADDGRAVCYLLSLSAGSSSCCEAVVTREWL